MSGYAVARLSEIDEVDYGQTAWRPVRHHLGITAFGVNAWTARAAGDRITADRDESEKENERLYVVQRGRAVLELDGERLDAPAGTVVFVRPGKERTVIAEEPGTTIIVVGASPGRAFTPDGWELWAPFKPLYEAGDYAAVVERGRQTIEADTTYAEPLYNLACCESLTGRTDDAIRHLRRAVDRSEGLRALAKEDSDFDPIRDEPAFDELVGG
jgi:mannose-6-phosphate isomerase-like protein (cupin superfamily)